MNTIIQIAYFSAAVLFILGLKRMSSPVTARDGIVWAGGGMAVAIVITYLWPDMHNYLLMTLAIALGGIAAWVSAKRVSMTDMPQMIALYNGMGGGAAAAIGAVELSKASTEHGVVALFLAVLGGLIGAVSFTGSLVAFAKLQDLTKRGALFPKAMQRQIMIGGLVAFAVLALLMVFIHPYGPVVFLFFVLALGFGVIMTMPIGGADMPVVISLYNALTGLAVGLEGFVLDNAAMIIAGTVVGSAGTLLTQLMAKAMNRSLANVLFAGVGTADALIDQQAVEGSMRAIEGSDAAIMMAFAERVIIIPGYGMAVAQAQHKVWELTELLEERGVMVKFAIHPVAGRMPGHMNVLLAEAGVPYDKIYDLEDINAEFPKADVALIIGANDVVNPDARTNKASPIYGMPILDADKAKNVIVIKRGKGTGFSGVENTLFYADNTRLLYGDGQKMASELIQGVKGL
ncbi:MAG: NAD(P)(+) transhydrogenase (Re/Si-specific) subunit beta [Gammaproteobacteria bacterium]